MEPIFMSTTNKLIIMKKIINYHYCRRPVFGSVKISETVPGECVTIDDIFSNKKNVDKYLANITVTCRMSSTQRVLRELAIPAHGRPASMRPIQLGFQLL